MQSVDEVAPTDRATCWMAWRPWLTKRVSPAATPSSKKETDGFLQVFCSAKGWIPCGCLCCTPAADGMDHGVGGCGWDHLSTSPARVGKWPGLCNVLNVSKKPKNWGYATLLCLIALVKPGARPNVIGDSLGATERHIFIAHVRKIGRHFFPWQNGTTFTPVFVFNLNNKSASLSKPPSKFLNVDTCELVAAGPTSSVAKMYMETAVYFPFWFCWGLPLAGHNHLLGRPESWSPFCGHCRLLHSLRCNFQRHSGQLRCNLMLTSGHALAASTACM